MMKFSVRLKQDITIIDLTGPVTIGTGDVALREAVREALEGGARKILLNLKAVTKMDSSGIGELVSAYTTTANRGGRLKLVNLPPKIHEVLVVTQLITVFEIYDDEDEAVSSF